jgi:uncharacterized protein YoaH (UPF0181 family)
LGTVKADIGDEQNGRRLTDEGVERVKWLMCEGMSAATARAEVLGEREEG